MIRGAIFPSARAAGLELRETQLVVCFGNPQAGTPIMQAALLAGVDLPLNVLVREDRDRTCVSYIAPAELAARYRRSEELAGGLAGIDALTDRRAMLPALVGTAQTRWRSAHQPEGRALG